MRALDATCALITCAARRRARRRGQRLARACEHVMHKRRILCLVILLSPVTAMARKSVPYPDGYRSWTHVKSMLINQGHPLYEAFGGLHHLYANQRALAGYKSGRFADGSVIVFDLLAANAGDNTVQEGDRKVVGVMRKNGLRYKLTGGWGFEAFKGDTRERAVGDNAATACYGCHTSKKDNDFVFSALRK